ncbi:MAG: molybdenum ABC transporter ATP-binding protein [Pseudomonadota bacterium]
MKIDLDLSATWGRFTLSARADLHLDGVTAMFGPSGSGKTSILSAIAGLRRGAGRIAVDGVTWQEGRRHLAPHRRPVALVFQDGRLFDHLSVGGNLRFAERRADPTGPQISMQDVIERMALAPLLDRRTAGLSGGERQRAAIARALLVRPRLMLMDEPLAALDRARKADILPLIAALPAQFDLKVLFVSHQLEEIAQIADRLIAVRDGTILGQGPVADMINRMDPAITGRFEAGALIEGTIFARDMDHSMIAVDLGGPRLWLPDAGGNQPGDVMRLRLRARDVSLALRPVDGISIRNQIPVTVTGVETDQGAFAEVRLDCAGQALKARISRMAVADLGLAPGMQVTALIKSIAFDRRLSRQ